MEQRSVQTSEYDPLKRLLLIFWYITIASAPFGSNLLRVELPVMGHIFLFRGAILFSCLIYLLMLLRRRENPFRDLSRIEFCFVGTAACMLTYGVTSAAWSLDLRAWFSKLFTMCQMFVLVFLFLKLCRDRIVMRTTLLLLGVSCLICCLGGLAECISCRHFFDTPYDKYAYVFFGKPMYAPIFTLYNPNGFTEYLLFALEILYLYMAVCWEDIEAKWGKRIFYALSAGMMLMLFLCCAAGGRLSILSLPLILGGLAVWLDIRYKRGLVIFIALVLCLAFIYVGEAGSGTLQTIPESITGNYENASLQQSDGTRVTLLKNSWEMLLESKGLGIGLGNAEIRMREFGNTGGILAVHCFIMEVLLEFGIFALIPLFVLVFMIIRVLCVRLYKAAKAHSREPVSNILFLLFTIMAYPFLSTASSSSWGITSMWLYIAMVLLYSGQVERQTVLSGGGERRAT